jgi:hypothetical protein
LVVAELQGQLDALTTAALTGQGSTGTGGVLHPGCGDRRVAPSAEASRRCKVAPPVIHLVADGSAIEVVVDHPRILGLSFANEEP